MASLKTLTTTPEILDHIFQYLPKPDILRTALTCKTLLPTSLNSLWKTLKPSRDNRYPRPDLKAERIFYDIMTKYWPRSPGIQYTKKIDIGHCLNWNSPAAHTLLELLEDGKLRPSIIELELYGSGAEKLLQRFKKYSESRSLVDFSIRLHATAPFAKLVDLHKVTYLELCYNPPSFGPGFEFQLRSKSLVNTAIVGCAEILRQTPNLTDFKWENGNATMGDDVIELNTIFDKLKILQDVFESFKRLRVLTISGYFFHPSFFLVPPRNVKKLVVTGTLSSTWWRKLAACPLVGLETLELYICDASGSLYADIFPFLADELPTESLRLEDVAVVSLKNFVCDRNRKPLDMYQSFVRRNPMIDLCTKRRALNEKAVKILQEGLELVLRELRKCKIAAINTYIKRFKEGHPPPDEKEFMADFSKLVITNIAGNLPEQLSRLEIRGMNIGDRCREQLQEYLEESINETAGAYAQFEEGKLGITEKKFMEDCIKKLADRVKESEDYVFKAERFVAIPIERFIKRMRLLQHGIIRNMLLKKMEAGDELRMGTVLDIWLQAVNDFEKYDEPEIYATGYNMYSSSMCQTGFDDVYICPYPRYG
ncbi:hypothetical protein TWF569_009818 [Orbilia oligospora]|nr:hypothetical protein TWF569_009818 [Orbilia oligospora]